MEQENNEFKACGHLEEVKRYCNDCKIFICDECSMEHMEHIESCVPWTNIIKEYLIESQKYEDIAQLLMKNNINIDSLKYLQR